MSLSVCPIAEVGAPAEDVWNLLADLRTYSKWSDAVVDRAIPDGPAQVGQRVQAHPRLPIIRLPILYEVRAVDAASRTLDLRSQFPFGIRLTNHITVRALDPASCQVSFG